MKIFIHNHQTRHQRQSRPGTTLIELLIYIAIAGILLGSIMMMETTIMQARQRMQAQVTVEEQGVAAMTTIAELVRNSSAVVAPATGVTGSSLSLTMPAPAVSPSVIDVSAGILRLAEGANAPLGLTGGKVTVTNLTIKNLTPPTAPSVIQISFALRADWGNNQVYSKTFSTSAVCRVSP